MENLLAQNQQQASRISDLEDQVRSAELALQSVQARMPGLEVAVEQPAHQGRVIAADADANIAIISLGAEDGVKPGFRYTVSRGSDYITTIEITDVQAKQSAGRSLRDLEKSPVRQGDRVMSR